MQLARGNTIVLRSLADYGADWNQVSTQVREVFVYIAGAIKGAAFVFDLGTLCIATSGI